MQVSKQAETTRKCRKCGAEKSLDEYYQRSGLPHLRYATCKACYRDMSKLRGVGDRLHSTNDHETKVIERLNTAGIPSVPGKSLAHHHADIIAWGCVLIEVKYSRLRKYNQFSFAFTPRQRQRGLRGDVIILICDFGDKQTYHAFPSHHPAFYRDGKLKVAVTYSPDRKKRFSQRDYVTLLNRDLMDEHEESWNYIEAKRIEIQEQLKITGVPISRLLFEN